LSGLLTQPLSREALGVTREEREQIHADERQKPQAGGPFRIGVTLGKPVLRRTLLVTSFVWETPTCVLNFSAGILTREGKEIKCIDGT
jgi:hypothetical protein